MSAQTLAREQPIDLEQARRRHAALVDKKFSTSLTRQEQAELSRLESLLDEAEAEFYQPAKDKLKAALAALDDEALKKS